MTLKQLIAKLIDLETEHGELPVYTRDGSGALAPTEVVQVTETPTITYIEIGR